MLIVPTLETRNLLKKFGGLVATNDLSFSIDKGEILGIIGPNGAGKTTVINMIAGTIPVTSGSIYFNKKDVTELPAHQRNQLGIARTFQTVRPLEDFTAIENVMVGALFGQKKNLSEAREIAREICELISLDNYNRAIDNVTVLELKKIELGRALASDPDLLFLDELMAGLNMDETYQMIELVKGLQQRDIAICVVEHIMRVVKELTDRVIVLDRGEIIAKGPYQQVSRQENVIAAYLGEDE